MIESRAADALTPLQKGALRAVTCDAVWPKDRFIKEGYNVDPNCELCKKEPDSMFHRIWECDCAIAMQARTSVAPPQLIREALARGPSCAAFTRGLGPDLSRRMEPPIANGGVKYVKNGCEVPNRDQWTLHGDVFYDGSCIQRSAPGLSRATWAVIQMGSNNEAAVVISGPVWNSLPQTAQAAEHCARTAAVELLTGPARLFGDSRNIVKDA